MAVSPSCHHRRDEGNEDNEDNEGDNNEGHNDEDNEADGHDNGNPTPLALRRHVDNDETTMRWMGTMVMTVTPPPPCPVWT